MRFLHPDLARWLIILPVAFCFWFLHVRAKRRFRRRASIGSRLRALSRLSTWALDLTALGAGTLAMGAIVLALMRPQVLIEAREPEFERHDLILILDRSVSMQAEDVRPSRFARATQEIKAFLVAKPEGIDRVGLVGFSGTSLVLSHLTRDVESLFFYLDWIREDPEPQFGTDIGAALASARELARKDDRPSRKIFLVLSDGDDQGQRLAATLASLRDEGTRVYCIGIGSEQEVPIPVSGAGGVTTLLEDEQDRLLTTRFDETTLQGIASLTGGRYFRSTTGTELATAMRDVARHERKLLGWKTSVAYRDVYHLALVGAAVATVVLLLTL